MKIISQSLQKPARFSLKATGGIINATGEY